MARRRARPARAIGRVAEMSEYTITAHIKVSVQRDRGDKESVAEPARLPLQVDEYVSHLEDLRAGMEWEKYDSEKITDPLELLALSSRTRTGKHFYGQGPGSPRIESDPQTVAHCGSVNQ